MGLRRTVLGNAIVPIVGYEISGFDRANLLVESGAISRVAPDIGDIAGAETIGPSGCVARDAIAL